MGAVYKYADFGFIGSDLWQGKGGTIFDNVIVCDDKAEADAFAAKWKALSETEKAEKKKADEVRRKTTRRRRTRPMTMMTTRRTRQSRKTCKAFLRFFQNLICRLMSTMGHEHMDHDIL